MHISSLIASLLSIPLLATAARVTITIPSTPLLQNPSTLPPSTSASLQSQGAPQISSITRANTFVFDNVSAGSYLLTVYCRDYIFEPLRVDVTTSKSESGLKEEVKAWQTFRGNEWDNLGEMRGEGGSNAVLEVRPLGAKEYYQERSSCEYHPSRSPWDKTLGRADGMATVSALAILKNPMILMALFSLVLVVGLPKLMENSEFSRSIHY